MRSTPNFASVLRFAHAFLQQWMDQMPKPKTTKRRSALLRITLSFLGLLYADCAHAITVTDPNFDTPSAAQTPNGFIQIPTAPATETGWNYDSTAPAGAQCGVQQNGSGLHAPDTQNAHQTAWLQNLCQIWQTITFPAGGDYTLTFKIAAAASDAAGQRERVQVTIGQTSKIITPTQSTGFDEVKIPFSVAGGMQRLTFRGWGLSATGNLTPGENTLAFIYDVAITANPPQITQAPTELDPGSSIVLVGKDFGDQPVQVKLHFPTKSDVTFSGSGSTKYDLFLDATPHNNKIDTEKIQDVSPRGAVDPQTVDISIVGPGGTSNVKHANFHNDAVITKGPATVGPNREFNLSGWDFGEAGKVKIHFPKNQFNSGSLDHGDVDAPKCKHDDKYWSPAAVCAMMPDIAGVAAQQVDITLITKDGRISNTWKAQFSPAMELFSLPWQSVFISCSNQGDADLCQPGAISFSGFCSLGAGGDASAHSIQATHIGCWGDSDNGTDTYYAIVANQWAIVSLDFWPEPQSPGDLTSLNAGDGTVSYVIEPTIPLKAFATPVPPPPPTPSTVISVPWHIGGGGGMIVYTGDIYIKGPKGVPY
jgi:hypothetical protein